MAVYPEYDWLPWKFRQRLCLENAEIIKKYVLYLEKELKIKEMKDWYNVTVGVIKCVYFTL